MPTAGKSGKKGFWDPKVMTPLMKEYQSLHVVTQKGRKKTWKAKPGGEDRAREIWGLMWPSINGLIYHVVNRVNAAHIEDDDMIQELHIFCIKIIICNLKFGRDEKSNAFSYLFRSLWTQILQRIESKASPTKHAAQSMYQSRVDRCDNKRYRRFVGLHQFVDAQDTDDLDSWLTQFDPLAVIDYIDRVESPELYKDIARQIIITTHELADDPESTPYKLSERHVKAQVTKHFDREESQYVQSFEYELARDVIQEAYRYYAIDHIDSRGWDIEGASGVISHGDGV